MARSPWRGRGSVGEILQILGCRSADASQLVRPAARAHDLRRMIIYHELKERFLDDVLHDRVAERIHAEFQRSLRRRASPSEVDSWRNSLLYMRTVLGG